jgi:hypothetical protein
MVIEFMASDLYAQKLTTRINQANHLLLIELN